MTGPRPVEGIEEPIRLHVQLVEDRLVAELRARVPEEVVRQTVQQQLARFAEAPVRQYIPLLVGRAARAELQDHRGADWRHAG